MAASSSSSSSDSDGDSSASSSPSERLTPRSAASGVGSVGEAAPPARAFQRAGRSASSLKGWFFASASTAAATVTSTVTPVKAALRGGLPGTRHAAPREHGDGPAGGEAGEETEAAASVRKARAAAVARLKAVASFGGRGRHALADEEDTSESDEGEQALPTGIVRARLLQRGCRPELVEAWANGPLWEAASGTMSNDAAVRKLLFLLLARNANLLTVSIKWCSGIGPITAAHLRRVLQSTQRLRELALDHTEVGDAGARHLARGVRRCATLTALSLTASRVYNEGATALAESLREQPSLQSLVYEAPGRAAAATHAAHAASFTLRRRTRRLHGNGIANEGALALASALHANTALTLLE